jgi:hypothetical protein
MRDLAKSQVLAAARTLIKPVYIMTRSPPDNERYGLSSQIRERSSRWRRTLVKASAQDESGDDRGVSPPRTNGVK